MNLKLNVIRFNNEDVIATSSCADAKGVAFYEEGHWFYALNGKLMTNLTGVQGSTEGLNTSNFYHVDAEGKILPSDICSHENLDDAFNDHHITGAM